MGWKTFALSVYIIEGRVVLLQLPFYDIVCARCRTSANHAVLVVNLHHFILLVEDLIVAVGCAHH